jgi:hypothetical protein
MSRDLEIQIVAKQFKELKTHGPALRQQSTTLPQIVPKVILELRIHNHDSLSNQGAILRAPDVKHVNQFGEGGRIEIAFPRSQGRSQSRSIHIKIQAMLLTLFRYSE